MNVLQTIEDIRGVVKQLQIQNKKVAFVPTMGALHDGHLSLIRIARRSADRNSIHLCKSRAVWSK